MVFTPRSVLVSAAVFNCMNKKLVSPLKYVLLVILCVWGVGVLGRFMVDAADHHNLASAKNELFALLDKPTMAGIPVLVLGNKRDLPAALDEKQLIDKMYVISACFSILQRVHKK